MNQSSVSFVVLMVAKSIRDIDNDMDELDFDFNISVPWFTHQQDQPYVLIQLNQQQTNQLVDEIADAIRRCYITDDLLKQRAVVTNLPQTEILQSKLPDTGSTMAGDFGEVFCYLYQSTKELPGFAIGVKKWRLKQDRTKPAPKSDVLHFLMPNRPDPSEQDQIICAEVKLKSTQSTSTPIASAIVDCQKDQTSRLSSTLQWLRARAMSEELGDIDIPLLDRFINQVDYPPAIRRFRAVAVLCDSLAPNEMQTVQLPPNANFTLVVIVVPNLQQTYEAVFTAVRNSVPI